MSTKPLSTKPESADRRRFLLGTAALGASASLAGGGLGFFRAEAEVTDAAITQTATFGADTERTEEVAAALTELVDAVEANEPGVLAYICHFTEDKSKVVFFEIYADQEALTVHGQQPHLAKMREHFGAGLLKPPVEIVKLDRIRGFQR